jgi:RNA binding exosome subunit
MEKNKKSFGDELVRLAKIVEIMEEGFFGEDICDIEVKINENKLEYLSKNLNNQTGDKIIINIDSVNFIFSKK